MSGALFYFGTNVVSLTAVLLLGAAVLMANPRSFGARIFAGVVVSSACYLIGRLSYAVPADVQVRFSVWPFLLVFMNMGPGLWMILAHWLFQDGRRIQKFVFEGLEESR